MIKTYIIIGLVFALVTGLLGSYALNMRSQRNAKAEKVTELTDQLKAERELTARQEAAIIKLQKEEQKNDDEYQKIRGEIRKASAAGDAPLAPVFNGAIEQLRAHQKQTGYYK